jgi:hypothetical protein
MSIRVLRSEAPEDNQQLVERERSPGEDNAAWLQRVIRERKLDKARKSSLLLLLGGTDPLSFRLRVAQSHVRNDLTPSAWSHVALLDGVQDPIGDTRIYEVSLAPPHGFSRHGFAPYDNGVQEDRLTGYLDASRFPNLALLSVPIPLDTIAKDESGKRSGTLDQVRKGRNTLDVPQMILRWLAYVWGVGVPGSPLAEGLGIPSAAVLEAAFAAADFDLTPGLESRSSCPEAIWQAARWWHQYYERTNKGRISGAYTATHDLLPEQRDEPPNPRSRAPGKKRGKSRGRKSGA